MSSIPPGSPLELIFLVLSVAGLIAAVWSLIGATKDADAARGSVVPIRYSANSNIRDGWFFVSVQAVMTLVAIISLGEPPPPPPYAQLPQSMVGITGYCVISFLMTLNSMLNHNKRKTLEMLYEHTTMVGGRRSSDILVVRPGTALPVSSVIPPEHHPGD